MVSFPSLRSSLAPCADALSVKAERGATEGRSVRAGPGCSCRKTAFPGSKPAVGEANSRGKHRAQLRAVNYRALEWQFIRKPCCFCTADASLGLVCFCVCFSSGTAWSKGM